MGLEGTWRISREAYEQGQGFAKSLEKGLPDPALAKGWKIWMSNEWQEDKNFTISRRSSVYPDVYIVEFPESLPEIRRKLQDKKVLGNYTRLSHNHDNVPVYAKSGGEMNLFRSRKGQWVFDRYVSSGTSSENAVLYQQSDKSPKPLEERAWVFEGIPVDLKLTPITQGRKDRPDVDPITKGKKNRPDAMVMKNLVLPTQRL